MDVSEEFLNFVMGNTHQTMMDKEHGVLKTLLAQPNVAATGPTIGQQQTTSVAHPKTPQDVCGVAADVSGTFTAYQDAHGAGVPADNKVTVAETTKNGD